MPKLELLGVVETDRLRAALVRCDGRDHDRREEQANGARIWFVLRGRFELSSPRSRRIGDPTAALLLQPGERFSIRHPEGCGDVCLAVGGPAADSACDRRATSVPLSNAGYLRIRSLARRLQGRDPIETIGAEESICEALDPEAAPGRSATPAERRLADQVAHSLAMRFDERLSLAELAAPHRVSVFSLCRSFRRARRSSIHRTLLRIRVRHALALMLDTSWSLARIAAECGFASHSHLTVLFRREVGSNPSRLRRRELIRPAGGSRAGDPPALGRPPA